MHGYGVIKLLNLNVGWIPGPRVLHPFIKDKNNWIFKRLGTNMSQAQRAWVFSHAGAV